MEFYSNRIVVSISTKYQIRSDQISRSVMSDSLQPHESQHARPPCPSPTPGVHWDSRPSSQWCHPAISSSVVPFSSCPQLATEHIFLVITYWLELVMWPPPSWHGRGSAKLSARWMKSWKIVKGIFTISSQSSQWWSKVCIPPGYFSHWDPFFRG